MWKSFTAALLITDLEQPRCSSLDKTTKSDMKIIPPFPDLNEITCAKFLAQYLIHSRISENGDYRSNTQLKWRQKGFKKEGEHDVSLEAGEDSKRSREMERLPNEEWGAQGTKLWGQNGKRKEGSGQRVAQGMRAERYLGAVGGGVTESNRGHKGRIELYHELETFFFGS